jgi:hypothetical protein
MENKTTTAKNKEMFNISKDGYMILNIGLIKSLFLPSISLVTAKIKTNQSIRDILRNEINKMVVVLDYYDNLNNGGNSKN